MLKSLMMLMNCKSFSFEVFLQKLEFGISRIHPCTKSIEYYDMFKGIYNFRNQEPID